SPKETDDYRRTPQATPPPAEHLPTGSCPSTGGCDRITQPLGMRQGVSNISTSRANRPVSGLQPVQKRDEIAPKKLIVNEPQFVAFLLPAPASFNPKKPLRFSPLWLIT